MFFAKVVAAAALVATALAQSGVVNTPASLVQCQPASLSWTVTKAPFFLSIIPGGQPSASPLVDFGSQNASPYVWTPNLAVGTSITIKLVDGDGNPYYSSPVTIQAGSSTSCLNSSGTSAAGSASAAASSASRAVSSAAGSASAAVSSAASSAAGVVSSIRSSAASAASSAASSVSAAASSVTGARSSGSSTTAASATSAAASSGAATKMEITGFGAVLLGAIGAIVAL